MARGIPSSCASASPASRTPKPRDTCRQATTRQEALKRALHEPWQALPITVLRHMCAKRFVVLPHDLVKSAMLWLTRAMAERGRHAADRGQVGFARMVDRGVRDSDEGRTISNDAMKRTIESWRK